MRDFKAEINEIREAHRQHVVSVQHTVSTTYKSPLFNNENLNIPGSFKGMQVKRFAESSIFDQYSQRSPSF